jgi:hypothetical protein
VGWLGRKFRALATHRGQIQGVWESPEPVEGTHQFGELLRKVVAATGYGGGTVSLVLAHPRLAHQLIEVPPAKGPALHKLLERAAQQRSGSLFTTRAAWSAQPAESVKGTPRYLLNLFPQPLLDELVSGAREAGLFLTAVLPPTAVLHNQLLELPSKDSEVVMLAADTGGTTTVLVGHSDGRVLLARALPGNWNDALPALALDLRRTMLFVNQQHSVDVQALFLFGPNAAERAAELQAQVGLPTRMSPTAATEDYWATEALRLQASAAQNFISREDQMAPQRRRRAWVLGSITTLAVLTCLASAFQFYRLRRIEVQDLAGLLDQTGKLQARHRELQELHAGIAQRRDLVALVAGGRAPAVPAWTLGYLSDAVPRELVLTDFSVRREADAWRLKLVGPAQPGGTNDRGAILQQGVTTLTNRLATGPLHAHLHQTAPTRPASAATNTPGPPSSPDWLLHLTGVVPVQAAPEKGFSIEGLVLP